MRRREGLHVNYASNHLQLSSPSSITWNIITRIPVKKQTESSWVTHSDVAKAFRKEMTLLWKNYSQKPPQQTSAGSSWRFTNWYRQGLLLVFTLSNVTYVNTAPKENCHTLVKVEVEVETRVGFIIRKNHHRRHRRHTGAFNIFLSNSRSILTKVET